MKLYEIRMNKPINFSGTKVNALFFNDMHASTANINSFKTAHDEFKKDYDKETNLVLSGGDNLIECAEDNGIVNKALSEMIDASACGNHDMDTSDKFSKIIKDSKFHWLAANLCFTKITPVSKDVKKSVVITKNGERIGIIGLAPFNFAKFSFFKKGEDYIKVKGLSDSLKLVRKEVEKLEAQEINRIFLLAHTGEKSSKGVDYYGEFAKIGGIDVIIGGHDHIQTERWAKSERNEPVKIVATGRTKTKEFGGNLDCFGILNLEFNDKGVLIKKNTKNTFKETRNYLETDFLSDFFNKDDFKTIFKFKEPRKWDRPLVNENKVADVVADSNLWYANQNTKGEKALFCFVNSGTIRDCFGNTDVNFNDIKKIVPFTASTLIKTSLTKKQIIDTLNWCVESTRLPKISPGLMQVSGLTYKIDKNNKVKDVCVVDKFGNILENIDNAPNNKAYTCVYDNYLATGVANLKNLVKDVESADVECFDVSRQSALLAYLKAHNSEDIWDINYPRIKAESV